MQARSDVPCWGQRTTNEVGTPLFHSFIAPMRTGVSLTLRAIGLAVLFRQYGFRNHSLLPSNTQRRRIIPFLRAPT